MIKDLVLNGNAGGVYVVENVSCGVTKGGSNYLYMLLADKTGIIDAKKWTYTTKELEIIKKGNVIRVNGSVSTYKDSLQIIIDNAYSVTVDDPNYYDVVSVSPNDINDMKKQLDNYILSIKDEDYSSLLKAIFSDEKVYNDYINFPAAVRNHHDFMHGILHHSLSMANLAESICLNYDDINRDLLISGCLLHDIGKIVELSGIVGTTYTKEGNLLGHLLIGVEIIDKVGNHINMNKDKLLLIEHLVASHHGKLEFGALVLPKTKEAFILSSIDDFDAKMMAIDKALATTEKDSFSERILALDNRSFLK